MKAVIKKQQSRSENSLVIYVNNKKQVNRMMLSLIESGFTVNYEPRYISGIMKDVFFAGIAIKLNSVVNIEQKNRKKE